MSFSVGLQSPRLVSAVSLCVAGMLFLGCGRPASEPARAPAEPAKEDRARGTSATPSKPKLNERPETTNAPPADAGHIPNPPPAQPAEKPQEAAELPGVPKTVFEIPKLRPELPRKPTAGAAPPAPGNPAVTRNQRPPEPAQSQEEKRRVLEYNQQMKSGIEHLKQKHYPEALRAFTEAQRHFPNDETATQGRREANYAWLMTDGDTALKNKKYAEAVTKFEEALLAVPEDKIAKENLKQARTALANQGLNLAAYEKHVQEGNLALEKKKYADAVENFESALKIKPGDVAATAALRRAEAALKGETANQQEYEKMMRAGESALKAKKYAEAVTKFEEALRSRPRDKAAKENLDQARAMIADQGAYEKHVKEGNLALERKKYADAVKNFDNALKVKPGDAAAATGLRHAEAALKNDASNQQEYEKDMRAGKSAMAAKKYADAAKKFEEALKDKPEDKAALAAIKEARELLAKDQSGRKTDYDKYMKDGNTALKAKKYDQAAQAFEKALKALPDDAAAAAKLKQAKAKK